MLKGVMPSKSLAGSIGVPLCFLFLWLGASAPVSQAREKHGKKEGKVSEAKPITGRFSGAPSGYVGRLILDLSEDGTYTLINLVSMHLPPQELENRRGKVTWKGAQGCLLPVPEAIEPCFTAQGRDVIQVIQRQGNQPITLQRIVEAR